MKYSIENRRIWFKGEVVNVNDAKVNVLAPTSQFGLNIFEGIPCYWNEEHQQLYAFRLQDHYARLLRSAKLLQITCRYTKEFMQQAFMEVIKANEYHENLSVRQTIFVDGFGSWGADSPAEMFIAPIPRKQTSSEYHKTGLHCCVTSWQRINDNALSPRVKCGANYMNSRLGQREALRNGYDTCIFLNEIGKISEGPGSCVFLIRNGKLITPYTTDSVLESITRDTVISIARELDIEVEERHVDRTEFYACDEAFLCGSAMEITPILSVDKYVIGSSIGKITQCILSKYMSIVYGREEKYLKWLTPIY